LPTAIHRIASSRNIDQMGYLKQSGGPLLHQMLKINHLLSLWSPNANDLEGIRSPLCRKWGDVACLATTWRPGRMPYFSEINAHQGLPSSESERGNRRRLASERAASGDKPAV
jgi:hypothetical protein